VSDECEKVMYNLTSDVGQGNEFAHITPEGKLGGDVAVEKLSQAFQNLPPDARVPLHESVDTNKNSRSSCADGELVAHFNHSRIQKPGEKVRNVAVIPAIARYDRFWTTGPNFSRSTNSFP